MAAIGPNRAQVWGVLDLTSNPLSHVYGRLAILYSSPPTLTVPVGGEDVAASLEDAGAWQILPRVQRDCLALREMLVRVDADPSSGKLCLHTVFPDLVSVRRDRWGSLVRVEEWAPDPTSPLSWVRLVHDITLDGLPSIAVYDEGGKEVSERVFGNTAPTFPRDASGRPIMPYVVYRAAQTGSAFDPYTDSTVVEGALTIAVLYSYWDHVLRSAAWRQRWAVNLEPTGSAPVAGLHAQAAGVDPSSLLLLATPQEGDNAGPGSVGTFEAPTDAEALLRSIQARETRLISSALGAADVTRGEADVRSGYSLAVSRESQREAQRAFEPLFRRADLQLLRLCAALLGAPETGWGIQYSSIPRDPQEADSELARVKTQLDLRLLDRVGAWQVLHSGASEQEAIEAIAKIDAATQTGTTFPVGFVTEASALAKATKAGEINSEQARAVLTGLIGVGADQAYEIAPDGIAVAPVEAVATPPSEDSPA